MARRTFQKRKRIFIGAEGESERSFARWLKSICDQEGLRVRFDVRVCGGGDGYRVVAFSVEKYWQRQAYGPFSAGFVLLDADRIEEDRLHGRDPAKALRGADLQLVYLKPNFEGLMLRLHSGYESRSVSPLQVRRELKRLWPNYVKPVSAHALIQQFGLHDLQRVARYDDEVRKILQILGLGRRN